MPGGIDSTGTALETNGAQPVLPASKSSAPAIDPNSVVDYLKSKNQPTDIASRSTLFASTFGSATPYTGSAAQNMALLTKLKGGNVSPTDPKSISGSSTVQKNLQTGAALGTAAGVIPGADTPTATPATPAPIVNGNGQTQIGTTIPAGSVKIVSAGGDPDGKGQQGTDAQGNVFKAITDTKGNVTGYTLLSKGVQGPNNPFNPPDPNAPKTVASFQPGSSPTSGTITMSNGQTQNVTIPQGKTYASSTVSANGDTVITMNDGSTVTVSHDPNIADQQNQAQNAKNAVIQQNNDNLSELDSQYQAELADLREKRANAKESAKAQYNASNPYGSGSDKLTYQQNIDNKYQAAEDELTSSYNSQKLLTRDQINNSLATIDANLSTNINNYKANVQSTALSAGKLDIANLDGSVKFDLKDPNVAGTIQSFITAGYSPDVAKGIVEGAYGKANNTYEQKNLTSYQDLLKGIQGGDGTKLTDEDLLGLYQAGDKAGLSMERMNLDLGQASTKAAAATAKTDAQIHHTQLMDAAILKKLSETPEDKPLTPTDIKNLKDQYPTISDKLNYGMTSKDAQNAIQNRPTQTLPMVYLAGPFNAVGLTADKRDTIRKNLDNGYHLDELITPLNLNDAQVKVLKDHIKDVE